MRSTPTLPVLFGLGALVLASGCAEPVSVFDEAGRLGSGARHYALGSALELRVAAADTDVTLRAADASVLGVLDEGEGLFTLEALAEGATVLWVVERADPTNVLGEHAVIVERPTSARILSNAEHALGATPAGADDEIVTIADGELRVRLTLARGDTALIGRGEVELVATPALVLEGDEGTHQVLVMPGVGHVEVEARAPGGQLLGARGIELVPASAIASVEIVLGVPRAGPEGETRVAVARARDAAGRALLGARYAWTIDGVRSERFDDVHPLPAGARSIEVEASLRGRTARITLAQ